MTADKAAYGTTRDGAPLYLPRARTRERLRGLATQYPEQLLPELELTGGTAEQVARAKYLKRLIAHESPDALRRWYGQRDGDPELGAQKPMTDEERARWFPEGEW